jgi:dipeptidyl aminopeptidase/acylaminoacyl peptidase
MSRVQLMRTALLALVLCALGPVRAAPFTIEQVLSAPFSSDLVAAPDGARFAWVSNASGRRNLWLATPAGHGAGYSARQLTHYVEDDGLDVGDVAFLPHGAGVLYVRGADFEYPDKPSPNPGHVGAGVAPVLYLVDFGGGAPLKLAEGHAPAASPAGDRVVFPRKGEVWSIAPQRGAKAVQLFKTRGSVESLRFSPDGTMLAFVSNRGDHSFVGTYSLGGQALRWVDASFDRDLEPRWSPDGTRLAFLRVPSAADEVGIIPHRSGPPWSIRVARLSDAQVTEAYRAPRGAGSVFHALSSDQQLFWTAGDRLVFPAENDGWLHFYSVAAAGGDATLLTPGAFEIEYAAAAPDGRSIIYSSNQGDIDRRHLWRLRLPAGNVESLTGGEGIETEPVVASDGVSVGYLCADARTTMHAAILAGGKLCADPARGQPADFPGASLVVPESVSLPARVGVSAHAILFLPAATAGAARRPAVIFMHGGPVRQMLLGWHYMDYYSNAYGLNQYLASRGFVVLALNYRSGIGYGLDFREADRSGAAGASEYNDLLAAASYLRARPDVDPARIGLWGGSYGGYMTALGLARDSDLFAAGVDLHGVHDWHHWSVTQRGGQPFYTLDALPHVLATALAASPLSAVPHWRSPVLLIHGDDDRNVDFSETVRLVAALRDAGVDYNELVFPDEIHGFLRHDSWLKAYAATAGFLEAKLKP